MVRTGEFMRVQSNFHDYYDGVRAYGSDPRLVYNRDERDVVVDDDLVLKALLKPVNKAWDSAPSHRGSWQVDSDIVGFCGKLYVIFRAGGDNFMNPGEVLNEARRQINNRDDDPIMQSYDIDRCRNAKARDIRRWNNTVKYGFNDEGWAAWLEDTNLEIGDEIFRHIRSPVFARHEERFILTVSPCLREYDFQRLVDPWTAYQEIAQYLGNNMVVQVDPTANISDKDMAAMKGHGCEYSFRTPPTKRRRR